MRRPLWLCTVLYESYRTDAMLTYSNKKETSNFYGTVSFNPVKMSQQKVSQNAYLTSDTHNLVII